MPNKPREHDIDIESLRSYFHMPVSHILLTSLMLGFECQAAEVAKKFSISLTQLCVHPSVSLHTFAPQHGLHILYRLITIPYAVKSAVEIAAFSDGPAASCVA